MNMAYHLQQLYTTVVGITRANSVCMPLLLLSPTHPSQGSILVVDGPMGSEQMPETLSRIYNAWAATLPTGTGLVAACVAYGCRRDGQYQQPSLRHLPDHLRIYGRTAAEAGCLIAPCVVTDGIDLDFGEPTIVPCPSEESPFRSWKFTPGNGLPSVPATVPPFPEFPLILH